MDDVDLDIIKQKRKLEITKIKNCNEYTKKYGITLTDDQIKNIIERKVETLKETGRIEFRESVIDKIIKEFCDSPYIFQQNYAETLYELIDIFYEYKNETMDLISDNELIEFMKKNFDGICQGDLDYLSGTVMNKMREDLTRPISLNNKESDDKDYE
ncbi:MAG: hypothetical protein GX682_05235 [Clostridiaceae bacterium]|nr:hypothetical protein [Clostridiaceae bacterium]